eukprot:TRINITY_DN3228_c0_g1_i1.p1 TRINITY_DN3228_c0_g1~~TRINITY_DN3228_c0_g1_i1.p1  ORF type:complete len:920 (-),score=197.60 TRINITY_DN3228_c0_g1_i1:95-2854(-)
MGQGQSQQKYQAAIKQLITHPVSHDPEFWSQFWTLPASNESIFQEIKPNDIRELKSKNPQNLAMLINQVVGQLQAYIQRWNKSGEKPAPNYLQDFNATINCITLVSRILPFVFEDTEDEFMDRVFWQNLPPHPPPSESNAKKVPPVNEIVIEAEQNLEPLAVRLLNVLLDLLFQPNFTIANIPPPPRDVLNNSFPINYIWAGGLGVDQEDVLPTPNHQTWIHRTEVLKCLLVCLSGSLYTTPQQLIATHNKWLDYISTRVGYYTPALFCTLVNIASTYDPVGWGVPYNHLMFRDDHEAVANSALQILNVLLNHYPHNKPPIEQVENVHEHIPHRLSSVASSTSSENLLPRPGTSDSQSSSVTTALSSFSLEQRSLSRSSSTEFQSLSDSTVFGTPRKRLTSTTTTYITPPPSNVFIFYIREIKRTKDFKFIFNAFQRLIANPLQANSTKLPYSMKEVESYQEFLMFFWRLLEENPRFLNYVTKDEGFTQVLLPLLHFMHEGRKQPSQLGMVHLGTYILLLLSGDREFSISLNKPFAGRHSMTDIPTFIGTHADLMYMVCCKLIMDGHERLDSIHECLLTVLANVSYYTKSLALPTCLRILKLFEHVSRPRFLFGSDHHYRLVHLLLEVLNNLVQYQYEGNSCLVYSILRCQNDFSKLAHLRIVNMVYPMHHYSTPPDSPVQTEASYQRSPPLSPIKESESEVPAPQNDHPETEPSTSPQNEHTSPQEHHEHHEGGEEEKHDNGNENENGNGTAEEHHTTENKEIILSNENEKTEEASNEVEEERDLSEKTNELRLNGNDGENDHDDSGTQNVPQIPDNTPFIPTNEWLESWKRHLPLDNIIRIITTLSPQIQRLCTGSAADETQILEFLQKSTLVGILSVPHPIVIRKYQPNEATKIWFTTYMWGVIFLGKFTPPLFYG